MPIQINTKQSLNEEEKKTLDRLLNEYYEKIKRELKKEIVVNLNLKIYEKGGKGGKDKDGKGRKYSLNLKIVNSVVFKSDSDDYDLAKAIHKAFNKVMSEIEHRLHVSNQNKKL